MIKYDSFYKYDEIKQFLKQMKTEHQDWIRITSLAKTNEGRDVILAEITDPSTGPADSKPAYYIQANLHAIEGAGVTSALHMVYTLLTDNSCRDLLKRISFYVVPSADPDGMEYALTTHGDMRSRYGSSYQKNELIPQDLNGDGYVLQMRWEDPIGPFKIHPEEPRLMMKREVGDTEGPFYQVVQEGIIRDYDGTNNIHTMRRVDFNRSYPVNWRHTENSTAYPLSEPEMRGIADFLVTHPNIFAGIDFHCGAQAILSVTNNQGQELDSEDLSNIKKVGKLAEKITGFPLMDFTSYSGIGKPLHTVPSSNNFAYSMLGISHYTIEVGWGYSTIGLKAGDYILNADDRTRADFIRQLLDFHDERGSQIYQPWEPFSHPQLGEIEIGGMMVGNARFMYPGDMEEIAPKTTAFLMKHAAMHPHLIIGNVDVSHVGSEVYRIRATVGNIGGFSTDVMKGGGSIDMKRPVSVRLHSDSDELDILNRSNVQEVRSLAALGGSFAAEWFVKAGQPGQEVIIEAAHPRGGTVRQSVTLG